MTALRVLCGSNKIHYHRFHWLQKQHCIQCPDKLTRNPSQMISHLSYWETRCADRIVLFQHSAHWSCSIKNGGFCTVLISHLLFPTFVNLPLPIACQHQPWPPSHLYLLVLYTILPVLIIKGTASTTWSIRIFPSLSPVKKSPWTIILKIIQLASYCFALMFLKK